MASKVVLDASAFLAIANREPGSDRIYPLLKQSYMSAVNVAEVLQKLTEKGMGSVKADEYVRQLVKEVVEFDHPQAVIAASLASKVIPISLSFGDRACLALGKKLGAHVVTANHEWSGLNIDVRIDVIRIPLPAPNRSLDSHAASHADVSGGGPFRPSENPL